MLFSDDQVTLCKDVQFKNVTIPKGTKGVVKSVIFKPKEVSDNYIVYFNLPSELTKIELSEDILVSNLKD